MKVGATDPGPRVTDEDPARFEGREGDGIDADGFVAVEAEGAHGGHSSCRECWACLAGQSMTTVESVGTCRYNRNEDWLLSDEVAEVYT